MADKSYDNPNFEAIAPAFKRALAKRHPLTPEKMAFLEKAFAERMAKGKQEYETPERQREREREGQSHKQSRKKSQRQSQ
jgi:hypothetical protein